MGLTLRDGDREYFYQALDKSFPGMKKKYIEIYGNAYELLSPNNDMLMEIFRKNVAKWNISDANECFSICMRFLKNICRCRLWTICSNLLI